MDVFIIIGSVLVIAAIISTRFAQHFGLPALVLFVLIGMLAGSSGPGGLEFADYQLSFYAGLLALAIILFSGGLDTRYRLFRASLVPGGLLATLGIFLTMLVVGLVAWALTPLSFLEGLLLGAVLAPTDAAAVFSVLKGRGLPSRLRGVLETESGTNDPMGIYLTLALTATLVSGQVGVGGLVAGVVVQLTLGGLLGYAFARALAWLINHVRMDAFGLYPVLALAGALLAYAGTNLLGGNGFLAIYVVGLVLGNRPLSHRQNIRDFMDSAAWGAQILMFVLLGLLVFPDQLPGILPVALLMTFTLVFLARPLAVALTLLPLRRVTRHYHFSGKELALLSWAGLKGAVPIILALVPLLERAPNGQSLFNIVFVVVIISTALQGWTVVPIARALGLAKKEPPTPPLRLELGGAAPPGSAIYDVFLEPDHPAVGHSLAEFRQPEGVVVVAIYRDGALIAPRGSTVFRAGDHVYLLLGSESGSVSAFFAGRED
ncbi:potassium/proton antiporter [Truepera radiovictrix]|uniref:Sodium/hydrogen exchanger n=1 Tax=Truepera radiovictrix (strain DSM 17093 / CIP 108686 / LMG 22925 / RQ-24) TaxID=649638 RepID=D7CTV9_TRURR|nr:potassium/proton antiporter [Truepera radiovictrix]ADI15656.1 sodium/hydrogen exchanger [Truepera radiovictrix DSM 17093]WMT58716.1 potassium/proton antiporter [Truepera radiovictrix]